jgi:hypothetical protein
MVCKLAHSQRFVGWLGTRQEHPIGLDPVSESANVSEKEFATIISFLFSALYSLPTGRNETNDLPK